MRRESSPSFTVHLRALRCRQDNIWEFCSTYVESEPSVFGLPGRRVADEAVYEAVKGLDRLRILVEVKAQKHYKCKALSTDDLEPVFYRMMQEVALARVGQLWHTKVLLTLATLHKWYFFRLADISDGVDSDVKFLIKQCFFHAVVPSRFPLGRNRDVWYNLSDVENIESHHLLVRFAVLYLCTH